MAIQYTQTPKIKPIGHETYQKYSFEGLYVYIYMYMKLVFWHTNKTI
jgi:hypothetical protein